MFANFDKKLRLENGARTVQRSALWRSRRELSNAYFLAKFGFDPAENEPYKVCRIPAKHMRKATPFQAWTTTRPSSPAVPGARRGAFRWHARQKFEDPQIDAVMNYWWIVLFFVVCFCCFILRNFFYFKWFDTYSRKIKKATQMCPQSLHNFWKL